MDKKTEKIDICTYRFDCDCDMCKEIESEQQATATQTGVESLIHEYSELLKAEVIYQDKHRLIETFIEDLRSVTPSPGVDVGKVVEVIKRYTGMARRCPNQVREMIEEIEALPVKSGDGWIRVEDEPKPKNEQWVRCCARMADGTYDNLLLSFQYSSTYDTYTGYGEPFPDERVTHWRPLPTPPQS